METGKKTNLTIHQWPFDEKVYRLKDLSFSRGLYALVKNPSFASRYSKTFFPLPVAYDQPGFPARVVSHLKKTWKALEKKGLHEETDIDLFFKALDRTKNAVFGEHEFTETREIILAELKKLSEQAEQDTPTPAIQVEKLSPDVVTEETESAGERPSAHQEHRNDAADPNAEKGGKDIAEPELAQPQEPQATSEPPVASEQEHPATEEIKQEHQQPNTSSPPQKTKLPRGKQTTDQPESTESSASSVSQEAQQENKGTTLKKVIADIMKAQEAQANAIRKLDAKMVKLEKTIRGFQKPVSRVGAAIKEVEKVSVLESQLKQLQTELAKTKKTLIAKLDQHEAGGGEQGNTAKEGVAQKQAESAGLSAQANEQAGAATTRVATEFGEMYQALAVEIDGLRNDLKEKNAMLKFLKSQIAALFARIKALEHAERGEEDQSTPVPSHVINALENMKDK